MTLKNKRNAIKPEPLAIQAAAPVRTEALPLEYPGVRYFDDAEVEAVVRV